MNNYLPIGTIVVLNENADTKFMVVGYLPINQKGDCRDYSAIRYPMGMYDNHSFFFFNNKDIREVLYKGYEDDDFTSMMALLKYASEKQNDNSQRGEENG